MKRIIITYGLIGGAIVSSMLLITMPLHQNGVITMDSGMWLGYTTMVIAMSMVFFGVRNYRENYKAGYITFGEGFKVGLAITIVASLIYATTWQIYYHYKADEFTEWFTQCQVEALVKDGTPPEKMEAEKAKIENFNKLYENPFIRFGFTLMEIFPVGLIITLITAAILRKREVLPA